MNRILYSFILAGLLALLKYTARPGLFEICVATLVVTFLAKIAKVVN